MANRIYSIPGKRSPSDLLPKRMAWEVSDSYSHAIKPFLWCMKIVGLLPGFPIGGKEQTSESGLNDSNHQCKPCLGTFYRIYSLFVILILLYNFCIALAAFQGVTEFDGIVCNQIITCMWFFQIAYGAVCNFFLCKHMKKYCKLFDKVAIAVEFKNYGFVRKCAVSASVLYIIWLLFAFTFTGVGLYFMGTVPGPIAPAAPETEVFFWILFLVVYFYFSSTWYLIVASFSLTSIVLVKIFKHFNRSFRECFDDGKFKGDIETKRFQHEQLSRLLGQADKVFSMFIMSTIGTVIPMIIFTLYFLLFESVAIFSYVATFWSAFLCITQLLIIFLGGGIVNHEVCCHFQKYVKITLNISYN